MGMLRAGRNARVARGLEEQVHPQDVYLRAIHAHPVAWAATNLLFAAATVLTAAGL